jgi:hypothetical protein
MRFESTIRTCGRGKVYRPGDSTHGRHAGLDAIRTAVGRDRLLPRARHGRRSTRSPTAPALTGAMNSAPDVSSSLSGVGSGHWASHAVEDPHPLLPRPTCWTETRGGAGIGPPPADPGPRVLSPSCHQRLRPRARPNVDVLLCGMSCQTAGLGFYRSARATDNCAIAKPGPLLLMTWAGTPGPCTNSCTIGTVDQPSFL